MKFAATRCSHKRQPEVQSRSQRPRSLWSARGIGTSGIIRLPTTGFLLSSQLRRPEPIRSNKKQETKIFMSDSVFFRQIRTYGITKSRAAWCVKAFVYGTIFPRRFQISVILVTDRNRSDFGTCGFELVKAYLYGKNSDEYSVAFRSFAKEGGHPKRYEEMVGLCEFWGFVTIVTTISNNTRLTYTRRMLPMKELLRDLQIGKEWRKLFWMRLIFLERYKYSWIFHKWKFVTFIWLELTCFFFNVFFMYITQLYHHTKAGSKWI